MSQVPLVSQHDSDQPPTIVPFYHEEPKPAKLSPLEETEEQMNLVALFIAGFVCVVPWICGYYRFGSSSNARFRHAALSQSLLFLVFGAFWSLAIYVGFAFLVLFAVAFSLAG